MRLTIMLVLVTAFLASPALAQTNSEAASRRSLLVVDANTGSPSNATTTVSPSTIPEAMERADGHRGVVSFSLGALYASGDFGVDTNTSIQAYALGARLRRGGWRLSASLPWMRIRSNATLFTGIDSTPVLVAPGTAAARRTRRGFGDLTLGAAYTLEPNASALEVELSGRVKLNTARRSSGLTSGMTDYALGAQVTRPVGRVAPFASVTYRVLGDPQVFRLRDGFAASAGVSASVGPRTLVLTSYHYAQAATRLVSDSHEVFAGASTAIGDAGFRLTGFGTAGLSNGAASVSAGIAISQAF